MKKWAVPLLLIAGATQASDLVLMNTIIKPDTGKDFIQTVIFKDVDTKCEYLGEIDLWKEEVSLREKVCQSENASFVQMPESVVFSADYNTLNKHTPLTVDTGDSTEEQTLHLGNLIDIQKQAMKSAMSGLILGVLDGSCIGLSDTVSTSVSTSVEEQLQCTQLANKLRTSAKQIPESAGIVSEIEEYMKNHDIPIIDLPVN